jgi:hypothetical protein
MMTRSIDKMFAGSGGSVTPIDRRPKMVFDKGNVLRMLESSKPLRDDSPAAAVALMSFVAEQQGEYQHFARSLQTTLLETCFPYPGAIRSNFAARNEALQANEGYLTSLLSSCELAFLSFKHSLRPTGTTKLEHLATDLETVATEFGKRNDQRRQASARIILAAVYLELRQIENANEQMSRALVLIGTLYNDPELVQLSTNINGHEIIDQTYEGLRDSSVHAHARELARGTTT